MKKSVLCIALALILLLTGCSGQEVTKPAPPATDVDYNDYVVWSGAYACTTQGVYFLNHNTLYFLDESQKYVPLCSKPQCAHQSADCSAYVDATSIYAVDDHLYYMSHSSDGPWQLYQMSLTGTERQAVNDIAVLKDLDSVRTSYRIAGEHFVLEATTSTAESAVRTIYCASLEHNAPLTPIFTDLEPGLTVPTLMHTTRDWVFAIAQDAELNCYMVGYEFATGKSHKLFQMDPMYTGNVTLGKDGAFVWSVMNEGIYQMRLGEAPSLLCPLRDWEQGAAIADDQYFYLSNMAAAKRSDTIDAAQTGVSIYGLDGEPVAFLPAGEIAGVLSYAFSTPQYVYFYDFDTLSSIPVCYLDKSEIGTDALCWHTVSEWS